MSAGGGAVFGSAPARRIAECSAAGTSDLDTAFPQLAALEREVLDLVAAALHLSPKSVRDNGSNVLTKLQVTGRGQAIVRARAAGHGR